MGTTSQFLINGQSIDHDERRFTELDGRTGQALGDFPDATEADANAAVEAARKAFEGGWGLSTIAQRQALLARFRDVLIEDYGYAAGTLPIDLVDFYREALSTTYGEVLVADEAYTNTAVRAPLGVVVVFVPVNSPALTGLTGCLPALAAGNSVVLKVPQLKVREGLEIGHALHQAGFPPGVVNVIASASEDASRALVTHPAVRLISFTGSTATAKKIMAAAAADLKRLHFNLGNKGPALLFADGDWEAGLEEMLPRIFPGQACSAPSRLLVEAGIAEAAIAKLRSLAAGLGPVPLIDRASVERVERYVERGRADGELLFGGSRVEQPEAPEGCWFEPTAFRFADQSSPVCREEIFGPVLSVVTFQDEAEALALANDTDYGLIAFLWTRDARRIERLTRALRFGTVTVNHLHRLSPHSPWGGFGHSGVGKHYGRAALDDFSEIKSIQVYHV